MSSNYTDKERNMYIEDLHFLKSTTNQNIYAINLLFLDQIFPLTWISDGQEIRIAFSSLIKNLNV